MKRVNWPMLANLLVAVVLSVAGGSVEAAHRFVCVDNGANRLLHVNQFKPETNWRVDVPAGSRDVQRLDSDRILLSHGSGCGIYRLSDGKLLWSIDGFKGIQTADYRADKQEILLGANVTNGYEFYVLEKSGEWFKKSSRTIHVTAVKSGLLRLVRFTPEGHLLFTASDPYRVIEWDAEKNQIGWSADLPGKGYVAIRRAAGTTVATTGGSVSVVVIGKDGKVEKTFLGETFRQQYQLNWFSGVEILPNGNFVVANWLGHGATGKGPHLVEVDSQNRIVWSWTDHEAAKQITGLVILDE